MKNKRWTKEEESILLKEIEKNPNNLKDAFTKTSEKINRSYKAVEYRWYGVLSKKTKTACFMVISPKTKVINKKTVRKKSKKDTNTRSIWNSILRLFNL